MQGIGITGGTAEAARVATAAAVAAAAAEAVAAAEAALAAKSQPPLPARPRLRARSTLRGATSLPRNPLLLGRPHRCHPDLRTLFRLPHLHPHSLSREKVTSRVGLGIGVWVRSGNCTVGVHPRAPGDSRAEGKKTRRLLLPRGSIDSTSSKPYLTPPRAPAEFWILDYAAMCRIGPEM